MRTNINKIKEGIYKAVTINVKDTDDDVQVLGGEIWYN